MPCDERGNPLSPFKRKRLAFAWQPHLLITCKCLRLIIFKVWRKTEKRRGIKIKKKKNHVEWKTPRSEFPWSISQPCGELHSKDKLNYRWAIKAASGQEVKFAYSATYDPPHPPPPSKQVLSKRMVAVVVVVCGWEVCMALCQHRSGSILPPLFLAVFLAVHRHVELKLPPLPVHLAPG